MFICRELWCDSVNAGGWWQSNKLYSTSLAVMSIIGYIIGLGDRHLDNVLVDLTSGQVWKGKNHVYCHDTLTIIDKVKIGLQVAKSEIQNMITKLKIKRGVNIYKQDINRL